MSTNSGTSASGLPNTVPSNVRYGTVVPTALVTDNENDTYYLTSNGLSTGTVISEYVMDKTSNTWIKANTRFRNLQTQFTSQATTKISLAGEIRWNGFYHIMTTGTNTSEPGGHFRIDMPANGFGVPVAGGTTRAVVPSVVGSSVDTGGILLNAWETLWYRHPYGQIQTFVPANLLIVPYATTTTTLPIFTNPEEWVKIASRDDASVFSLGTGDVVGLGSQTGRGGKITNDSWSAMKQRAMGNGYFFVPGGNTANNNCFGFTGEIRWINGGSTPNVNSSGYVDVSQLNKVVGTAIRGVNGAGNRTWRLMTAAEKPTWFGGMLRGANPIVPATTTVVDLADNEILYYVPNIDVGGSSGQWVVSGYAGFVSTPAHWLPIASKQITGGHSTTQVLVGGVQYALKSGDARYTTTNDATMDSIRRNQNITYKGLKYCRWTLATQFTGTGVNGLLGSPYGIYSSWDDNALIYGISDGYSNFGNQYTWINMPSAGYNIPVVNTNSNITRAVKIIGGRRYIPLGLWEALFWIPPAHTNGIGSVNEDFVIAYYGNGNHHLPPSAVMILKYEGAGVGNSGSGTQKNRIKFADGTYIQPGIAFPPSLALEAENDHAQGSGSWRAVTVAGGTAPGMTAPLPVVAGVIGPYTAPYTPFYRYNTLDSDPRGQIEIEGLIQLINNIVGTQTIAFLNGVKVRGEPIYMAIMVRTSSGDKQPIPVQVRFVNQIINGQSGVSIQIYNESGNSTNNYATLGPNGGTQAPGTPLWISLGPITLPHE